MLTHHPGNSLVVHPFTSRHPIVEFGSDSRRTIRTITTLLRVLHSANMSRQLIVGRSPSSSPCSGVEPGIERGPRDVDNFTQPLHAPDVLMVFNELEAAHQFVSPAKYLAA